MLSKGARLFSAGAGSFVAGGIVGAAWNSSAPAAAKGEYDALMKKNDEQKTRLHILETLEPKVSTKP